MGSSDGIRKLLIKYLLYDALLRPGAWNQAVLNDRERAASWLRALAWLLQADEEAGGETDEATMDCGERSNNHEGPEGGSCRQEMQNDDDAGSVVFLGSAGADLPLLPMALSCALLDTCRHQGGTPTPVVLVEPIRPISAATVSCIEDNDLSEHMTVVSDIADVKGPVKLLVSTALEDVSGLPSALDSIQEALQDAKALAPGRCPQVVPSRVELHAVLLHIPPGQPVPIRSDVKDISGFDLSLFNRFRQSSLSDTMRLADVKHLRLSQDLQLASVETSSTRGSEDIAGTIVAASSAASSGLCNAVALWVEASCYPTRAAKKRSSCGGGGMCGGEEQVTEEEEPLRLPSAGPPSRSRRQLICHLPGPVALEAGGAFRLSVCCDPASSSFRASVESAEEGSHGAPLVQRAAQEGAGAAVVERWHFGMVNDWRRNDAYDRAIREAVSWAARRAGGLGSLQESSEGGGGGEVLVLDIGAGSGLLSMMAARASPQARVTAVERVSQLARCAAEIVTVNGFARQVAVVHGESTDLEAEDLEGGGRADLLVSEILDDGLLGEGVIPTIAHARQELLKPGAPVIPSFASIWAVVIECPMQPEPVPIPASSSIPADNLGGPDDPYRRACTDLDLGAFDIFHPTQQSKYHSVRLDRLRHRRLCRPVRVFDFDFQRPLGDPASAADFTRTEELLLEASANGSANAVAFWFTAKLFHDSEAEGPPEDLCGAPGWADICSFPEEAEACGAKQGTRCWTQAIHFLAKPCEVEEGGRMRLQARHGPSRVTFKLSKAEESSPSS